MRNQALFQNSVLHRAVEIAVVVLAFALAPFSGASAYTLKTLHSFCAWDSCHDGVQPIAGLVMDQSGNLYGTTQEGGKNTYGVVFKLIYNPDTGNYKEAVIHNFCAK